MPGCAYKGLPRLVSLVTPPRSAQKKGKPAGLQDLVKRVRPMLYLDAE